MTENYFTAAYAQMSAEETERYHQTVFMNMESSYAAEKRIAYYRRLMRHVGQNVSIGCGVRIVNPQWISLGDNVQIHDRCTLSSTIPKKRSTAKGVTNRR